MKENKEKTGEELNKGKKCKHRIAWGIIFIILACLCIVSVVDIKMWFPWVTIQMSYLFYVGIVAIAIITFWGFDVTEVATPILSFKRDLVRAEELKKEIEALDMKLQETTVSQAKNINEAKKAIEVLEHMKPMMLEVYINTSVLFLCSKIKYVQYSSVGEEGHVIIIYKSHVLEAILEGCIKEWLFDFKKYFGFEEDKALDYITKACVEVSEILSSVYIPKMLEQLVSSPKIINEEESHIGLYKTYINAETQAKISRISIANCTEEYIKKCIAQELSNNGSLRKTEQEERLTLCMNFIRGFLELLKKYIQNPKELLQQDTNEGI